MKTVGYVVFVGIIIYKPEEITMKSLYGQRHRRTVNAAVSFEKVERFICKW